MKSVTVSIILFLTSNLLYLPHRMEKMDNAIEFRKLFGDLEIPKPNVDEYMASLSQANISTLKDFFENMERLGIRPADMKKILDWKDDSAEQLTSQLRPGKKDGSQNKPDEMSFIQPLESAFISRLTREAVVVILKEVGHGASGHVSKALYCPNLTFLAIKCIDIENPVHRILVGQELKSLYEIARCNCIGPPGPSSTEASDAPQPPNEETHLNLLSGQLYTKVIAGISSEMNSKESVSAATSVIKAANNPFIINFYDAYIDPEHGAVCLLLEYMNCGSIQSMLNDGLTFDEDDAAVLAFSVLTALTDLHGRNILHRDIKPSNILTDTAGRVKLADFGITKEILEDGPAAESFIGTIAYMSPERIRGVSEYSFEADMWSLGITMITVMTGNLPFPTENGSWQLMKAILERPQPTITKENVSSEMHDFIHQCLNQPLRDKSCVQRLLSHAFLSSARERGILPMHKIAILAKRGKLRPNDLPTNGTIERIVEVAISWQLERFEDECLEDKNNPFSKVKRNTTLGELDESDHQRDQFIRRISRFSKAQIEWLAFQMGAETSVLEDKFNARYALIDKASDEGLSIEGIQRAIWPNSVKHSRGNTNFTTVDSSNVSNSGPITSSAKVAEERFEKI